MSNGHGMENFDAVSVDIRKNGFSVTLSYRLLKEQADDTGSKFPNYVYDSEEYVFENWARAKRAIKTWIKAMDEVHSRKEPKENVKE